MAMSRSETRAATAVTARARPRFSTKKKEVLAISQPVAEASEPTSVTGTSKASPKASPARVASVTATTALEGVRNCS